MPTAGATDLLPCNPTISTSYPHLTESLGDLVSFTFPDLTVSVPSSPTCISAMTLVGVACSQAVDTRRPDTINPNIAITSYGNIPSFIIRSDVCLFIEAREISSA